MKGILLVFTAYSLGLLWGGEPELEERIEKIILSATGDSPLNASEGVTESLAIPSRCQYVSHDVEIVERYPAAAPNVQNDGITSYEDRLKKDASGRITGVSLRLFAGKVPSPGRPSKIAAHLSVLVRCDPDRSKTS